MKVDGEIKKAITKGDIILIVSLVLLSVLLFALSFFGSSKELTVKIYSDSQLVYEAELSTVQGDTVETGGCKILVEKDGVSFVHSQCDDKLCVKRGKLSKNGDTMACVPQRVAVVIAHRDKDSKFDALTY